MLPFRKGFKHEIVKGTANKKKLVEKAFQSLMISHNDQVLANEETDKMVFESFKGFSSEGVQ